MQSILIWYLTIFMIGIAFFPLCARLFSCTEDRGWLYAKTIGLFVSGWILWMLNCLGAVRFGQTEALIVVVCIAAIGSVWDLLRMKGQVRQQIRLRLIIGEELLFLILFLAAIYVIGFKPEAYGTEKFMDYGFLTAIARSDRMPFEDPWYAGYTVNYYYGGQYLTGFLMKLSMRSAGESYNLMRATVTALSFVLPFALVRQLMADKLQKGGLIPNLTGLLGGTAVAFCGNGHYVLFGILRPLLGIDQRGDYWFPDSTRYIGYNPDVPDKTIHEFPAYSSVLGDLHAHYVNLIFVLSVIAIVYAWAKQAAVRKPITNTDGRMVKSLEALREILRPEILLIGFLTGAFRWTNFWDFPIYFVVAGAVIFFVQLRRYQTKWREWLLVMLGSAAVMFLIGKLAALPFTSTFYQISSEIGMTHSHTRLDQLIILWGLPIAVLIAFLVLLVREEKPVLRHLLQSIHRLSLPDLTVLLFGLCAAGLVWLPEVIYVKDIYGEEHHRANTMFKLTYQAFLLFGMVMAYAIVRMILHHGRVLKTIGIVSLCILLLTSGYLVRAVSSWFGNVLNPSDRVSTDASVFVSEYFPSDFEGINWLNENIHDTSTILEAPGDSYSDYERVSVATGLPTVAGWYVHEWLWRSGHEGMDQRLNDISSIYTGTDADATRALIEKYHIRYIYIGQLEREKYPDLQDKVLQSLGETVYSDGVSTYILKVG